MSPSARFAVPAKVGHLRSPLYASTVCTRAKTLQLRGLRLVRVHAAFQHSNFAHQRPLPRHERQQLRLGFLARSSVLDSREGFEHRISRRVIEPHSRATTRRRRRGDAYGLSRRGRRSDGERVQSLSASLLWNVRDGAHLGGSQRRLTKSVTSWNENSRHSGKEI